MSLKIPALEPRFLEPPGWRWHIFKNNKGKKLRFGTVYPESRIPSAVVVILPGRAEHAEKYFEVARDLLAKNLSVWILEWQGQGLSERFLPKYPQRGHSLPFDQHVEDLHDFILEYVKHACVHPDVGRIPMVMLAHSMGANIGLQYLHAHPGMFECAALTAPLMGIPQLNKIPFSPWFSRLMAFFAGNSYAPGQKDWAFETDSRLLLSTDPVRGKVYNTWLQENPELQLGGVTYGWLYHALQSCLFLQKPKILHSITPPCLVAVAGKEQLVDNHAIRHMAGMLPHARLLELPEAGHEILMERDDIRNIFMNAFFQLVKETVIDKPGTLKTF